MITRDEILMGRDAKFPLSLQLERNLERLLTALNIFREEYGLPMVVSSGYRPGPFNVAAHGANNSAHLTCEACDFRDVDRAITRYALANIPLLERAGLFQEAPHSTPTWIHLQIRPTNSRVFEP